MKSTRFVFSRALAVLCALFFVSFSFMSCQQEDDDNELPSGVYELSDNSNLIGTWKSSYGKNFEIFAITSTSLSNSFSDSGNLVDLYAGNNLLVSYTDDKETSGYIYIKYTRAINPADVGKWYAIAFWDLTSSSLSLSGAYKKDGKTSAENLEDAISTFTIGNGYFGGFSECVKQ
ncbi:hypothetical protein [Treponema berlinense]|uniref:hypothetical protein n=1 Tax=Treponema berlinense TaxID=225004 RepID=UPI003FD83628